jgi:hypothetical protein
MKLQHNSPESNIFKTQISAEEVTMVAFYDAEHFYSSKTVRKRNNSTCYAEALKRQKPTNKLAIHHLAASTIQPCGFSPFS